MPAATLDAILHPMWDLHFSPLITLEVFSLDDFLNSHQAMLESHERYITKHLRQYRTHDARSGRHLKRQKPIR